MGQEIDVERIRINTVRPVDKRKVARKAASMRARSWSLGRLSWLAWLSWIGPIVLVLVVVCRLPFCSIESGKLSEAYSSFIDFRTDEMIYTAECEVRNAGFLPISSVRFRLFWMDGNRSIPIWSADGNTSIPGGIQPGETKIVRMAGIHPGFNWRSFDRSGKQFRVEIVGVGRGRGGKPWSVYPPATIEIPAGE